jgi:transcription antitermination protein NusB
MTENTRRIERERILSLLYEAEIKGLTIDQVLAELPVAPETFVINTVKGVAESPESLDKLIDEYAIDWKTERMATVDRTVLRIGAWELTQRHDLPVAVVISEAIELVKRFSTEESGKFVNGILAAMAKNTRPS